MYEKNDHKQLMGLFNRTIRFAEKDMYLMYLSFTHTKSVENYLQYNATLEILKLSLIIKCLCVLLIYILAKANE